MDSDLAKDVIACYQDTSYLADFFEKINTATNKLYGKNITLAQSITVICGLINQLQLYQPTLSRRDFRHFSRLSKMSHSVSDNHLLIYVEHLKDVKKDINVHFKDLLDLEVFSWLAEPFASNINECDSIMQEMLINLQSVERFVDSCSNRFPEQWEKVKLFILVFPATYIAEPGCAVHAK